MSEWLFYAGLGIALVVLQVALEALLDERRDRRHARLRHQARMARVLLTNDTSTYALFEDDLKRVQDSTDVDW